MFGVFHVYLLSILLLSCRASPAVTGIQPSRVPTTGNISITVTIINLLNNENDSIRCQINPPPKGTTHILNTTSLTFPGKRISKTQVMCINVPRVTAPGPGILTLTFLNHQASPATKPTVLATNVTYFTPIDWTVSKRPYIHDLDVSGDILFKLDATYFQLNETFTIAASLPAAGNATWEWHLVATPTTFPEYVLPLSFEQIKSSGTTIHNDLQLTILRVSDGTMYRSSRRFHKVPSPPSSSTGKYR